MTKIPLPKKLKKILNYEKSNSSLSTFALLDLIIDNNKFEIYYDNKKFGPIEYASDVFSANYPLQNYLLNILVNENNIESAKEIMQHVLDWLNGSDYMNWFLEGLKITKEKEENLLSIWPQGYKTKYDPYDAYIGTVYQIIASDDPYWESIKEPPETLDKKQ